MTDIFRYLCCRNGIYQAGKPSRWRLLDKEFMSIASNDRLVAGTNQEIATQTKSKTASRGKTSGASWLRVPEFRGAQRPGKVFWSLILVPALVALGVSGYLAWVALTGSKIAGCGGAEGCSHVLTSKWSTAMGIPVALFAAVTWLGIVAALGCAAIFRNRASGSRLAWSTVQLLGVAAALAALWFISLQVFVIGHLCKWCLAAHTCGLLVAALLLIRRPFSWAPTFRFAGVAVGGLAVLVAIQFQNPEPKKYEMIVYTPSGKAHVSTADDEINTGGDTGVFNGDVFAAPGAEEEDNVFESPDFDDASHDSLNGDPVAALHSLTGLLAIARPELGVAAQGLLSAAALQEQDRPAAQEGSSNQANSANQETNTQDGDGSSSQDEAEQQEEVKPERRLISILGGSVQLDVRQWPLLGDPEAEHVFVEMFDYCCPHCRNTHRAIEEACATMGDDVAIIVLPVPLNAACNNTVQYHDHKFAESCELARLAVACWRVDAEKFAEFHSWMFAQPNAPSYAAARQHANTLFGSQALTDELAKSASSKYVSKHVELYRRAGSGTVPKILFPRTAIQGEYCSGSSLVEMIRREAKQQP